MSSETSQHSCLWVETDEMWETQCGGAFSIIDGTPRENNMAFCCYCGKPLEQMTEAEATDDDWPSIEDSRTDL